MGLLEEKSTLELKKRKIQNSMHGVSFWRKIKYFLQRGKRGFSDYDLMDFDEYLSIIIIDGLFTFMNKQTSIPSKLFTKGKSEEKAKEEWDNILYSIIQGFAVAEDITYYHELSEEDKKTFDKGFALFKKWFFHLWY